MPAEPIEQLLVSDVPECNYVHTDDSPAKYPDWSSMCVESTRAWAAHRAITTAPPATASSLATGATPCSSHSTLQRELRRGRLQLCSCRRQQLIASDVAAQAEQLSRSSDASLGALATGDGVVAATAIDDDGWAAELAAVNELDERDEREADKRRYGHYGDYGDYDGYGGYGDDNIDADEAGYRSKHNSKYSGKSGSEKYGSKYSSKYYSEKYGSEKYGSDYYKYNGDGKYGSREPSARIASIRSRRRGHTTGDYDGDYGLEYDLDYGYDYDYSDEDGDVSTDGAVATTGDKNNTKRKGKGNGKDRGKGKGKGNEKSLVSTQPTRVAKSTWLEAAGSLVRTLAPFTLPLLLPAAAGSIIQSTASWWAPPIAVLM